MTAPAYAPAIAFLRRAGLLAAVLALLAGIFGMHVLTATHALHSTAASGSAEAHHGSSPEAHTGKPDPDAASAPDPAGAGDGMQAVQCAVSGNCTSMQSMAGACTPSAKTASLSAPLPGTAIITRAAGPGDLATISPRWSYQPVGPSLGDLCISRT